MGHTSHLSGHGRYRDQSVIVPGTRTIDPANPADVASHDRMVALVEQMLTLHRHLPEAKTDQEKTFIRRQIEATDAAIDALVYELYGLSDEEIKVIEGMKR